MKNYIKSSIVFSCFFLLINCTNDDDANNSNKYVGIYIGQVNFSDGLNEFSVEDAEVEVIKVSDNIYELNFPHEIPDLIGLEYEDFNSALLNINADENHLVRITEITLQVIYTDEQGRTWNANCQR